jgi:flavin-dependent dehydrogenase
MPGRAANLRVDACVVGSGPAGAVAAHVLTGAGARVALIVRNQPNSALAVGETVPAEMRSLLKRLGLDCLTADLHLPSAGTMARWGSDDVHFREAILSPYGCGWHLDRQSFERQLIAAAIRNGATVIDNCTRIATTPTSTGWQLQIESGGREICGASSYLMDCTGRGARFAVESGARRQIHDKLVAIWCVAEEVNGIQDPDKRMYLESAPAGWLYSAQIPKRRRVMVFFTDGDLGDVPRLRSRSIFEDYVANSFHLETVTGGLEYRIVVGPFCVNAASARLLCAHGDNWIAAGDAAQSFDPLSSQGIMSAIIGGSNAAAALIAAHSSDHCALEQFQADLDGKYESYLAERHIHYSAEQRWKDYPFWHRRHDRNFRYSAE